MAGLFRLSPEDSIREHQSSREIALKNLLRDSLCGGRIEEGQRVCACPIKITPHENTPL